METLQTPMTIGQVSEPLKKPLITEKKHDNSGAGDRSNESNYVDLGNIHEAKADAAKTVKVTFTGDGNQLAIFKCKSDTSSSSVKSPGEQEKYDSTATVLIREHADYSKDIPVDQENLGAPFGRHPPSTDSEMMGADIREDLEKELKIESFLREENQHAGGYETQELKYTDMYLNSRCESEDATSVALSDKSVHDSVSVDAESHYITTHEIQLTELDHDVDYEFGRGSCWDYEDDNLVYSFVDYASFESDETTEAPVETTDRSKRKIKSNLSQTSHAHKLGATGAPMSTESEFCESDKLLSSDESPSKTQNDVSNSTGQIHLSIKASSRAINNPISVPDDNENTCFYSRRAGERSHYFVKTSDSNEDALYDRDRAHYFIPAPGRQHLASKLKGKDINEYSSGASSSVSELDDADKEVRNLTAKSFRSLACPYFDAINLRTSSESSLSEHGFSINKWSAFVDLNYGNLTQGREHNKNPVSSLEMNKRAECKYVNGVAPANTRTTETEAFSSKYNLAQTSGQKGPPDSFKKVELRGRFQPARNEMVTLTETLNFSCSLEGGLPTHERRAKSIRKATGSRAAADVSSPRPTKMGCEPGVQLFETEGNKEDVYKKAIFASSLLTNVISKKMQLEQERKMERGETRNTSSPCSLLREQDLQRENVTDKCLKRETSETGSELSISSQEDLTDTTGSLSPADKEEVHEAAHSSEAELDVGPLCDATVTSKTDSCEGPIARGQNSAFKTWKDGEQQISEASPQSDRKPACALVEMPTATSGHDRENTRECVDAGSVEGANSRITKMSHLYVPSSHLVPKEREPVELPLRNQSVSSDLAELEEEGCEGGAPRAADTSDCGQVRKPPEIKIRLRSVKEKKPLNIANLLTPNIGYNSARHGGDSKSHLPSASEKVPHFMVRDIRDTKCKIQTPIHQVRDVRKLVKSSYRFVSLENTENKARVSALCQVAKKEPDKKTFPVPMVIKCQSVNTNSTAKRGGLVGPVFDRTVDASAGEADAVRERLSPKHLTECAKTESMCRAQGTKQMLIDQAELKTETKSVKQKRDKIADSCDKKPECKFANQAALEKLKAAVKTMEQLYVFDRNEWKRKTEAPRPITDSHVLSLISSEEHGFACKADSEDEQGKASDCEKRASSDAIALKPPACAADTASEERSRAHGDTSKTLTMRDPFDSRCVLGVGSALTTTAVPQDTQRPQQCSFSRNYPSSSTKGPVCLKICPSKPKPEQSNRGRGTTSDTPTNPQQTLTPLLDSENYLTIPGKSEPADTPPAPKPRPLSSHPPLQRSPVVSESWSPEIPTAPHHAFPAVYPHLLCLSPPAEAPVTASNPQRKLLVDPATGQCYLVDTPIPLQPATQRLFYPDSGLYLDVPLAVAPLPVSPIALSPAAAYAPAYLFCPSALVPPHSQAPPVCPEGESTREAGLPAGVAACANPLISITSQQGARIIAPPSFDGTTVSFVVEHR